jgi:hypothetical protein
MPQADASPTKSFFVNMITRDITLEACILDLIDNSLDGARRDLIRRSGVSRVERQSESEDLYSAYLVSLTFDENGFYIEDNCGGISVHDAENYAFHFGRRPDAPAEAGAIGLYGVGLKRAVFKIGTFIEVRSSTASEAFTVEIDVNDWLGSSKWTFPMIVTEPEEQAGTSINVWGLHSGIANELTDPLFVETLKESIARDYSFYLARGFRIHVNSVPVIPYNYQLRRGGGFTPCLIEYDDEGVHVKIVAGLASLPQEDTEAEATPVMDPRYLGWFIICNDRVVLAADKSSETIWGNAFPVWHPQFNGFMGLAFFSALDPSLLPWTTTKRGVDASNPVFQRATTRMKQATRVFIAYTHARKDDLEAAREAEAAAESVPISTLRTPSMMRVPPVESAQRVQMATIQYRRHLAEVRKVAAALGNAGMSFKQVGIGTYEYYLTHFVED